jgi:hypothetical protein
MAITAAGRHVVPLGRRNVTVDLTATGTSWTQGGTTFTLSGAAATGSSVTTKIVNGPGAARLVLTIGTTAGTLTVSDGTNSIDLTAKRLARWPAKGYIPGM